MESAPRQELDALADWRERKRLGAFYTPAALSDLLCNWAITSPSDLVLEPSFGGCGFLESGVSRLRHLGAKEPNKHLFGCDIDTRAFDHLSQRFGGLVDLDNFKKANFLTFARPDGWPPSFDAVVGNPPYLSYHHIHESDRTVAQQKLAQAGFDIPLKSSTWAYFVALSLDFLREGGRFAWVLPGSFLQTNYATPLRNYLASKFRRVHAFQIRERLFLYEGTDEQTIILLADGFSAEGIVGASDDISMSVCENVEELPDAITFWETAEEASIATCGQAVVNSIAHEARACFEALANLKQCKSFSELAVVRIGLVTGANYYFLLSPTEAVSAGLKKEDLHHTLGKFIDAPGLSFSKRDRLSNEERDRRCLLVHSETAQSNNKRIQAYLDLFPKNEIKSISTFKKRSAWPRTDDGKKPDAFFPVMHHLGPKIVLNHAKINCTNTIHRVYFREPLTANTKKLIAISFLTTFSQLSAEIVGRKYGSGVLKHEPREAERVQLILPTQKRSSSINKIYKAIDTLLRSGNLDEARKKADMFILAPILKNDFEKFQSLLDEALVKTRALRHPGDRTKARRPTGQTK